MSASSFRNAVALLNSAIALCLLFFPNSIQGLAREANVTPVFDRARAPVDGQFPIITAAPSLRNRMPLARRAAAVGSNTCGFIDGNGCNLFLLQY